jgi:molybdopterin-containing oxidoreductase family membrane subunit
MVTLNFLIPVPILAIKKLRNITGTVIASACIVAGMWLERFLIVVPSLSRKYLPYAWGSYQPTWVEMMLMASGFALMALLYLVFSKIVPMIAIWELKVGMQHESEARAPAAPDPRGAAVVTDASS